MSDDPSHFLNELPIWKLKLVAAEYGIDVASCRYKRDFVEKVRSKHLTEEQVRKALSKETKGQDEGAIEVRQAAKEVEQIAARPLETTELPIDEETNVERNLDEALSTRPSFFEADSMSESAYNRMILGDYFSAIKANREARLKCLETFSGAQVYSAAVSIRAADELLAKLSKAGGRIDPSVKTALAEAKKTFISGSPRRREEALESLETLVTAVYKSTIDDSEKAETELRELLADYESFGTRTEEARKYLEIAGQAKAAFNLDDYSKFLGEARMHAEKAKKARAQEIDNSFHIVRAGAEEAKAVGADVSFADAGFEEARKAFDGGSFKRTVDLLADIERATDSAHMEQIQRQRDLESVQLGKVRMTVTTLEPLLAEAASYGMNAQEGLYFVDRAKAAMARRDVVNAAKFARRAKDVTAPLEKDLEHKRVELGIVKKVEGAKCEKCGLEAVYLYPNTMMKCLECGYVRNPTAAPQAGPVQMPQPAPMAEPRKRRGLFKW